MSENDNLILEDDTGGRVTLVGASESSLPVENFVSGMVIAVKGVLVQGEAYDLLAVACCNDASGFFNRRVRSRGSLHR